MWAGKKEGIQMKQFIIKLMPFLIFCSIMFIVFPVMVDPYNVFHYMNIRDNAVEPNRNYIKTRYIIENPDKFDAYLFGSSRAGFVDTGLINGFSCYNMFYSAGLVKEHYENLKAMADRNVIPKMVIISVDDISCYVDPDSIDRSTDLMRKPLVYPPPPPPIFPDL
jgi:hypothetical protein